MAGVIDEALGGAQAARAIQAAIIMRVSRAAT